MMRTLPRVFVVAAIFLAADAVWAKGGVEAPAGRLQGEVVYLEGEVTVDGKQCTVGQKVPDGATVGTGAASLCEIVFGKENVMRLLANTMVAFELKPASPGVHLSSGSVAIVFNKVKALGSTFRVATSSAIAGVRGTVFFIRVEDGNNTYVCACNGEVAVSSRGIADTALSSMHHLAQRFTAKDGTTVTTKADLLYHDDALMNAVAARIGVVIPWDPGSYGAPGKGGSGY
jgi:hypothetical protein